VTLPGLSSANYISSMIYKDSSQPRGENCVMSRTRLKWFVLPVAALLGVAGCSSSGNKSAAGGTNATTSSPTSTPKATGSPITVAVVNEDLGNGADWGAGVKIAVAAVNASGGIDGHPVQTDVCNLTIGDVNGATQCVRNAINNPSVVAFVNNTIEGASIAPLIAQAGIACLGCTMFSPGDFNSPTQFGDAPDLFSTALGALSAVKELHLPRIALPGLQSSSQAGLIALVKGVIAPAGGQVVTSPSIPITAVDVSAPVAAMGAAHPQAMVDGLTATVFSRVIHAMRQQGQDYPVLVSGGVYDAHEISNQLAGVNSNIYVVRNVNPDSAGFQQMLKEQSKYDPSSNQNDDVAQSWMNIRLFLGQYIASKIPSGSAFDRTAVLNATKQVSGVNFEGMTPNLNFSQPVSLLGGTITRQFNPSIVLYKYDNGKETPVNGGSFVTLLPSS